MPEYDERDFNREEWGEELSNIQPRILRDEVYGDPRDWGKKPTRPARNGIRSHIPPSQIHGRGHSDSYLQA